MLYKDYTSNPIPTSFFKPDIILWLCYEVTGKSTLKQKNECKDGVTCCGLCIACLACILLPLHLVAVVFGTAIPAFLNIFEKCFLYLFVSIFLAQ